MSLSLDEFVALEQRLELLETKQKQDKLNVNWFEF